ncbi:hypothetical protein [Methylosinus sporium]|uniref:hypothetical protein n=1 Tax=Methylosinus sporium TaxID=428 RepID=UPI001FCE45DF|nr:hypothetical protein [Methylosinus sporium]
MNDDPPKTPPIIEQRFIAGVNVVDIGDVRVSRGLSRRPFSLCHHRRLAYDEKERRVWCQDCETDVEPFDAFRLLVEQMHRATAELERQATELNEAMAFQARQIATKKLDKAWRSRTMVPACPHCNNGLFPEHFKDGLAMLGRDYAEARLKNRKP